MKTYTFNNIKYELVNDYKDGFNEEEVQNKLTDYFEAYDYILGDWAYGKLRLKGFCDKKNKIYKKINDIDTYKEYVKENCAYECKYFLIKKV